MKSIEQWIEKYSLEGVGWFHMEHLELINASRGSNCKHQAWEGGYRDHLEQCMEIAEKICDFCPEISLQSVFIVIYFHDIEKIWKYTIGLPENFDKNYWYNCILPDKYNINFTAEELNALKYIHGEGNDYSKVRIMNELAAVCHSADVISARVFYGKKKI